MAQTEYVHKKDAKTALLEYGYTLDGEWYVRNTPTDMWKDLGNGKWLKIAPAILSFDGNGPAWGKPISLPGYVQVPFQQTMVKASGEPCHPMFDPEMYEWEWPEDYVAFVYENASGGEENTKVKVVDKEGKVGVKDSVKDSVE